MIIYLCRGIGKRLFANFCDLRLKTAGLLVIFFALSNLYVSKLHIIKNLFSISKEALNFFNGLPYLLR